MRPLASLLPLVLAALSTFAYAYEEEDALALAIGTRGSAIAIDMIDVRLDDDTVDIAARLSNHTRATKRIGFNAVTPFFSPPGIAEDNYDKDFPSLTVAFGDKTTKLATSTTIGKGRHQGQRLVVRSWFQSVGARATDVQTISYQALPQIGRDDAASDRFAQLVSQHCGDIEQVKQAVGNLDFVLFDRYEIPVTFMKARQVQLSVHQTSKDTKKRALISLACGLTQRAGNGPDFSALLVNADASLSILVISAPPEI